MGNWKSCFNFCREAQSCGLSDKASLLCWRETSFSQHWAKKTSAQLVWFCLNSKHCPAVGRWALAAPLHDLRYTAVHPAMVRLIGTSWAHWGYKDGGTHFPFVLVVFGCCDGEWCGSKGHSVSPGKKVETGLWARYSTAYWGWRGFGVLWVFFECSKSSLWHRDVNYWYYPVFLPVFFPVLFIANLVVYQSGKQPVFLSRSMCCSN